MSALQSAKVWAMGWTGLGKDALHIYVGLLVFIALLALTRWRIGTAKPLLVVAAVALAGELWDLRDTFVRGLPLRLDGNWHDLWNTCFWPAVLTALARWTSVLTR